MQEQQIVAEVEARIAAEAARTTARLRVQHHIVDKILTCACPRCGQAFDEFTGCMALTCSRVGCGCCFCAICQKVRAFLPRSCSSSSVQFSAL